MFFHKHARTLHLPHNMQQSMHYSYVLSRKPAVTGRSNGHHQDQYSRQRHGDTFSGLWTSYHTFHVFLHISKRLSTLNIDFSRNTKAALRQEFNLFSMQKKKTVGKFTILTGQYLALNRFQYHTWGRKGLVDILKTHYR